MIQDLSVEERVILHKLHPTVINACRLLMQAVQSHNPQSCTSQSINAVQALRQLPAEIPILSSNFATRTVFSEHST
jgi:hypothetical protein